jgi:hypothetical protein
LLVVVWRVHCSNPILGRAPGEGAWHRVPGTAGPHSKNAQEVTVLIIWKGLGFLVPVIAFACFLLMDFLTGRVDETYYSNHAWPMIVAGLLAAAIIGPLGWWLNRRPGRTLRDEATGERVTLRSAHSLFWVPMEYWAIIVFLFATGLGLASR